MNCQQAHNLFDAYLNGELPAALATEFGAHKLRCPNCRRELALLEVAGHVIASDTQRPVLSGEFTDRLLACATQAPVRRTPWRRILAIGAPLAAAACLLFVLTVNRAPAPEMAPRVLGENERIDSTADLREQVKIALEQHPDNPDLQRLAEALRNGGADIVQGTRDGADMLEKTGKEAVMKLLKSLPVKPEAQPAPAPADSAAEEEHAPVEENP
jgi:hypothetical protein